MSDRYFPGTREIIELLFERLAPLASLRGYDRIRLMDEALEIADKPMREWIDEYAASSKKRRAR